MAEGKVKWFNEDKGYGFIQRQGKPDLFFNIRQWRGSHKPQPGDHVTFSEATRNGKPEARSVTPVEAGDGYRFLNPYNFVRSPRPPKISPDNIDTLLLSRCPVPPHDRMVGLSGTIECEIKVLSPLFVSDSTPHYASEADRKKGHKTFRFFHYDFGAGPEPALPASSLRGMVRSVFEAVTNSCYVHFEYNKRLSYHLPAAEALKLVPARAEKDEHGHWRLRLLPGTARLIVDERPSKLYAARVERYKALAPGRKRRQERGAKPSKPNPVGLKGLQHGDLCFALAEELSFPPVWNVIKLARTREELLPEQDSRQKIFEGYLCLNNQNIEAKRFERFFFRAGQHTNEPEFITLPDDVREKYGELIQDYQSRHADRVKKWRRDGKDPACVRIEGDIKEAAFSRFILAESCQLQEGDLVYAMLSGSVQAPTVKFIVPVAVPRVSYERKVAQLLDSHLWKCSDYWHLCPACRMFGWVYGRDQEDKVLNNDQITAYAGRVRFEHARLLAGQQVKALPPVTLSILSTPKPTTSRFYLKPRDGKPRPGQDDHQAGYDNPDNILRGRKVYRHQGHSGDQTYWCDQNREYHSATKSDQNRTVEGALLPGTQFEFKLEFENLAPVELGALLWSLQMEGTQSHRLGYAKPLGFGSIHITIRQVSVIDPSERYGDALGNGKQTLTPSKREALIVQFKQAMSRVYGQPFEELPHVQDLLVLLGEPDPSLPVHYPRPTREPSASLG